MKIWQVKWAYYGTNLMDELLQDGWEPFAVMVSETRGINTAWEIWLRKLVNKQVTGRTPTGVLGKS